MIFEYLDVWLDSLPRSGPEAMAVDEWLLETRQSPTLRMYRFHGAWASIGYFGKIKQARESLEGVNIVRRWTGGGTVDHRADWTYSLIIPKAHEASKMKGSEIYRAIHTKLILVLANEGSIAQLSTGQTKCGCMCFENPVEFDVLDADGQKLAGAAQKKSKHGLLHQGSVALPSLDPQRGKALASELSSHYQEIFIAADEDRIQQIAAEKYSRKEWLELR
jgi:lipoyl(octanoyl) transferase